MRSNQDLVSKLKDYQACANLTKTKKKTSKARPTGKRYDNRTRAPTSDLALGLGDGGRRTMGRVEAG